MGRKRNDRDELDYLRDLVRQLKAENRNLRKSLGSVSKKHRKLEYLTDSVVDAVPEIKNNNKVEKRKYPCPNCKSNLTVIEFPKRTVLICSTCKYRRTTNKNVS